MVLQKSLVQQAKTSKLHMAPIVAKPHEGSAEAVTHNRGHETCVRALFLKVQSVLVAIAISHLVSNMLMDVVMWSLH